MVIPSEYISYKPGYDWCYFSWFGTLLQAEPIIMFGDFEDDSEAINSNSIQPLDLSRVKLPAMCEVCGDISSGKVRAKITKSI